MVSLSSLYCLVSILCVLQILSSILTMSNFEFGETCKSPFSLQLDLISTQVPSQFFHICYAGYALGAMQYLIPATRRTDHPRSNVNDHISSLASVVLAGFLAYLVASMLIFAPDNVIPPCVANRFMSVQCAPLMLDLTVPVAIVAILLFAVFRIHHLSRAIYGNELIALSPPPPPPTVLVPAWGMGTVAEVAQGGLYRTATQPDEGTTRAFKVIGYRRRLRVESVRLPRFLVHSSLLYTYVVFCIILI
ncbi:hypothetical protein MVEN_00735100 [Mycena venus]|uniref:Uncharacterized protein n=1 Tax=Mycena venus TaxID=2733690 RepID=A0A8H7D3F5_9AGAR|nr:hypothetical protein MVEN_00735100 [Mycena venus]